MNEHVIPLIYSRFDIVWPDDEAEPEDLHTGVDALTYGLSTLAMGEHDFNGTSILTKSDNGESLCPHCGCSIDQSEIRKSQPESTRPVRNSEHRHNYAQYIRKLSIGNGPPQYVRSYTADKESGKMLNTLVTQVIRRTRHLENFNWDMPTGLTRDVWLALASISRPEKSRRTSLLRLWVRMHDPRLAAYEPYPRQPSAQSPPPPPASTVPPTATTQNTPAAPFPPFQCPEMSPEFQIWNGPTKLDNVAYPRRNFSLLGPLRSLSVLAIDAPEFLYEMSDLIARSNAVLKELRVGLASFIANKNRDWKEVWEGEDAPDPYKAYQNPRSRTQKRAGGVLGTLFGRFFSVKEYEQALAWVDEKNTSTAEMPVDERLATWNATLETMKIECNKKPEGARKTPDDFQIVCQKLHLDVLELNHVELSVKVLAGVIDWTKLTTLTLLSCPLSEQLWLYLRRTYAPKPPSTGNSHTFQHYPLSIRKIRTDTVSMVLIKFLTDALGPNTLNSLILKERYPTPKNRPAKVNLKQIFKGPLRRHAASLQQLSIDSAPRKANGFLDSKSDSAHYQQWLAYREVLGFITSGAMSKLKELCISIQYKDWHYFLRRLPRTPQLQVLYIPVLHHANQLQNCRKSDPEDLACQVADAVTYKPEIELCYFANHNHCFEIFECQESSSDPNEDQLSTPNDWTMGPTIDHSDDEGEDVVVDEDDDGDDTNDDTTTDEDTEESDSDANSGRESWTDAVEDKSKVYFDVKDILFPDEKSEVFKARRMEL